MMIFLNGPFGVGKTTTARLLVERIPHARLYDPEHVGAILRATLGKIERVSDYQDHRLWPRLTVEGARLLWVTSRRPLVIPMTIARRDRFDFITSRLRRINPDLLCVRLTASREVLKQRILGSSEGQHWRLDHLDEGMALSGDPAFGQEIPTEGRIPAEVADVIMELPVIAARTRAAA
jgi:adenylate kinase family enzyme